MSDREGGGVDGHNDECTYCGSIVYPHSCIAILKAEAERYKFLLENLQQDQFKLAAKLARASQELIDWKSGAAQLASGFCNREAGLTLNYDEADEKCGMQMCPATVRNVCRALCQ
jgi:hypothetical protein